MSVEYFGAYLTKYALTLGILYREGEVDSDFPTMFTYAGNEQNCVTHLSTHAHAPYWHRTFEDAQAHAEKLRKAKLDSLKKQVAKLEAMKFNFATQKPVNCHISNGPSCGLTARDVSVEKQNGKV